MATTKHIVRGLLCLMAAYGMTYADSPPGASDSKANAPTGTATTKPMPAEYRMLAKILARSMNSNFNTPASSGKKVSELTAEAEARVMDLRQIHSTDDEISRVTSMSVEALDDLIKQIEGLNVTSMSKPLTTPTQSGAAGLLVDLVMKGSIHGALMSVIAQTLANAKQPQNAKDNSWKQDMQSELAHVLADSDKLAAASLLLPKVAAKYSAPMSSNTFKIAMSFVEAWGPLGYDVLELENPGPDLDDCTITVNLVGAKDETCTNVHFVTNWASKMHIDAAYSQGESVLGHLLNQSTVSHVKSATVFVQSPKFSTQLSYTFDPQFQDKAVAAICKNMKLIGSYTQKKPLLGATTYAATITLNGVAILPSGQINLTLHKGTTTKSLAFQFKTWTQGEVKTLTGLPFVPESADVVVAFPDTGYRYETKFGGPENGSPP
jgi:hypothetical protein